MYSNNYLISTEFEVEGAFKLFERVNKEKLEEHGCL